MANQFSLDVGAFCAKAEKNVELAVKKIAFELFTLIVRRSPVDTGRFRANNQITLNSLPAGALMQIDKQGNGTISHGNAALTSFKLGDTIFISNNLAYAVALEHGHSKQAPSGVYRISVEDLQARINSIVKGMK